MPVGDHTKHVVSLVLKVDPVAEGAFVVANVQLGVGTAHAAQDAFVFWGRGRHSGWLHRRADKERGDESGGGEEKRAKNREACRSEEDLVEE